MLRLTHRPEVAAAVLGDDCLRRLVFAAIVMDGTDMVRPLVLTRDDVPAAVFVSEVEQPALAAARPAPLVLHGYYFTWDTEPRASLAECVVRAAEGARVTLDAEAPAALHHMLSGRGEMLLSDAPDPPRVHATVLPRSAVETAWRADEAALRTAARRAASRLQDARGRDVTEHAGPDRFGTLDRTLEDSGLSGVLASSPLHVQALTGFSIAEIVRHGTAALYLTAAGEVVLLSRVTRAGGGERPAGQFSSIIEALASLANGAVGYEDLHLAAGVVRSLRDRSVDVRPASAALRRWETRTAGANAPGFLLASLATVQAIEFAIAGAHEQRRRGSGFTEEDLDRVYREALGRFAAAVGLPAGIRPYFDIVQAGERTPYPAVPTSFAITDRTRTVKFDMGVQVVDGRGLIRGCSDIARTCAFGDAASAMNDVLDQVLRNGLPRTLRPGVSGAEAYRGGVASLKEHEEAFRRLGYLAPHMTAEGYRRDCGHALGRQTPSSVHFLPDDQEVVEDGMVICEELVWPVGNDVFAVEDIWFVGPDGPVNVTRHTGWAWV
jgi:Xaa-Pro aminopeptidase